MKHLLWLSLSLLLWSANAEALTLDALIQEVRNYYPPVQESRAKLLQVRGKLLEKEGNFDTKYKGKVEGIPIGYYRQFRLDQVVEQATPWWGLQFLGGYRLGLGKFADYDGKKETNSLGEIRVGFEIPLLRDGPIDAWRAEIAILESQVDESELAVFAKQLEATRKGLKTYWNWLITGYKLQVAQDLLKLSEERMRQLEAEVKQGKKPPVDLLENRRALVKRQAKQIEVAQKWAEKSLELGLFFRNGRLPSEVKLPPLPQAMCPPETPTADLEKALQQRPELLMLALRQEQNQIGQRLAANQLLPDLRSFALLSQDFGTGSSSREPLELETGVGITWPIQNRKAEGFQQQLQAEAQILETQMRFLSSEIRAQVNTAHLSLNAACQQIALAETEVQLAQALAEAEAIRFNVGGSDLFGLNLREQAAAEAQERWLDAQETYGIARGERSLSLGLLP